MAVELYPDNNSSIVTSPRISFSYDLNQSDIVPIEPHIPFKSSFLDYDFNFCVTRRSHDQESSMADELFSNGVILPLEIKKKHLRTKSKAENTTETEEKQGNNKKSFWKFKRSKSLNCGSIYSGGFCPMPLLSRSKSTGSTSSAKKSLISKDEVHHHKQSSQKNSCSSNSLKPPLNKNYGSSSFNSRVVQVSPILNVPTGRFLGFGGIFSSRKDKSKKK